MKTPKVSRTHLHKHLPGRLKVVRTDDGIETVVLHFCRCGDVVQSRLPGTWTWDEVTTPDRVKPEKHSDKEFLRRMGIAVK